MGRQGPVGRLVSAAGGAAPGVLDDLGAPMPQGTPERVVSLVPSLSDAIAGTDEVKHKLVGCTDWCTHVHGLEPARLRGTKNPRIDRIVELGPDVVIANKEENRRESVEDLRAAGVTVYVTDITTVAGSLTSMRRLLSYLGVSRVPWLDEADRVWARPVPDSLAGRRVVVPIWRKPWMGVGADTFSHDMLTCLGLTNVLASSEGRYPEFAPADLAECDVVILPDEPYAFSETDGPQFFDQPTVLIDGRYLTWYGPSLVDARDYLLTALS